MILSTHLLVVIKVLIVLITPTFVAHICVTGGGCRGRVRRDLGCRGCLDGCRRGGLVLIVLVLLALGGSFGGLGRGDSDVIGEHCYFG